MEFREEVLAAWRQAYEENPGLESFKSRKKALLWGVMGLFALQKLVALFILGGTGSTAALISGLFGAVVGLAIPGIFVLAVWRGNWRFSLAFLLPAAYLLFDVLGNGLPALTSGDSYYPVFYLILGLEAFLALYLIGVTLWLSVPQRNRELGDAMNRVNEYLIHRSKEIAAQTPKR